MAGRPLPVPCLCVVNVCAPVLVSAVARHEVRAWAPVLRLLLVASPTHLLVGAQHLGAVCEGLHTSELALGLLQLLLEAHGKPVARGSRVSLILELELERLDLPLLGVQLRQK